MVDTSTSPDCPDTADDASPAERRRQRVREAILDAAERVFAESGEDGLSIRRLAEEIDYSPAAIYKYFASKDELLDVLKEGFFARLVDQIDDVLNDPAPFEQRARKCLSRYILTALERPQHYAAAFSGTAILPVQAGEAQILAESSAHRMRAFDFLVDMMREGQAGGVFRSDTDAVLMAKSAWVSLHGAAMLMAHLPDFPAGMPAPTPMSREAFVAVHVDHIFRGLAA